MRIRTILILILATVLAFPAMAQTSPGPNAFAACLTDSTNGKERKQLAKWIFVAMATHPELQDVSNISTEARTESDRNMGVLVTRLLTEDCVSQARAVMLGNDSSGAFKAAFASLGALAMQEIMSNHEVEASFAGWQKYFDQKKFQQLMGDSKSAPATPAAK